MLPSSLRFVSRCTSNVESITCTLSLISSPFRAHSTSLSMDSSVSKASHLAASLHRIAQEKCKAFHNDNRADVSDEEEAFTMQSFHSPLRLKSCVWSTPSPIDSDQKELDVFPRSFDVREDALEQRPTSLSTLGDVKKRSHREEALEAVLQSAQDCGRAGYFKHVYRQQRSPYPSSQMGSMVSSSIGSYGRGPCVSSASVAPFPSISEDATACPPDNKGKTASTKSSFPPSSSLSQDWSLARRIQDRWKRLPAHRKLHWILHSPQGPHLCRVLFHSPLLLKRSALSLVGKQRRVKRRGGVRCGRKGRSLMMLRKHVVDEEVLPSPSLLSSANGSSWEENSMLRDSVGMDSGKLSTGSKPSVPLGVQILLGYEKSQASVRHRPWPRHSGKDEQSASSRMDGCHHHSRAPVVSRTDSSLHLSSADSALMRPCFLPFTACEVPVATQRVAEAAAASRRRQDHLAWKRVANSLLRDQRGKCATSTFLKYLKAMQHRVGSSTAPGDLLQRGTEIDGEEKVLWRPLKIKGWQRLPLMEKCNSAANNAIAEKDFQDYCTFFKVHQSPRKAYVMGKLEPLLDEIECSPDKQLEKIQELTHKFSLEFDEEMKKRDNTAAEECAHLLDGNLRAAVQGKEYFFSPEWLKKCQREKAKSGLQKFQDKLPYWKKRIISF